MEKAVRIYDTTLRDGTQGEGVSFSVLDKLRIAEKLDEFGADYIEGGWPGSNPKDVEFFQEAAKREWKHARVAAFGSTRRANVAVEDDPQIALLLSADTPVVTYFGKSWKLHVTEVLRTTVEENLAMIRDTARYLKANGKEVVYDAEHFVDGYKDDPEHGLATLRAAKEGGADILVLCDTNGGTMPSEVAEITGTVKAELGMAVGIHTHDDCGLGVANALAAVGEGAEQVQGTINGYGERTGNCNLTSVIPNLQLKMGLPVTDHLRMLTALSHFVDDLANCAHNVRAPYVGTTCFSHKGGMHVNAVQKLAKTYEHIEPEEVGNRQHILVSELSGQSNVLLKAEELGFEMKKGDAKALEILEDLKRLEKEGYEFEAAEASFELLVRDKLGLDQKFFDLLEYHCTFRRDGERHYETCSATVKMRVGDEEVYTVAEGDGPVDALDNALRKALEPVFPALGNLQLQDYKVRIIDSHMGAGSKTRVLIDSSDGKETWSTVGVSYNIIAASWEALVASVRYCLLKA
ncbi:MAG: citramalate synthase [Verrucomicrobiales bacterium]|nr:citramalate synthase [Verrucomicrobiales bacterium]